MGGFMGGFHTILVNLKILFKKYGCLGFKDWWVDAGAIAESSVAQAIEGRHYYRSVCLHKQSFEALIRYRMRNNNISTNFDLSMKKAIASLRLNPCAEVLTHFYICLVEPHTVYALLTSAEGTQAMTMEYLICHRCFSNVESSKCSQRKMY